MAAPGGNARSSWRCAASSPKRMTGTVGAALRRAITNDGWQSSAKSRITSGAAATTAVCATPASATSAKTPRRSRAVTSGTGRLRFELMMRTTASTISPRARLQTNCTRKPGAKPRGRYHALAGRAHGHLALAKRTEPTRASGIFHQKPRSEGFGAVAGRLPPLKVPGAAGSTSRTGCGRLIPGTIARGPTAFFSS